MIGVNLNDRPSCPVTFFHLFFCDFFRQQISIFAGPDFREKKRAENYSRLTWRQMGLEKTFCSCVSTKKNFQYLQAGSNLGEFFFMSCTWYFSHNRKISSVKCLLCNVKKTLRVLFWQKNRGAVSKRYELRTACAINLQDAERHTSTLMSRLINVDGLFLLYQHLVSPSLLTVL